jgi:hypothetical protein
MASPAAAGAALLVRQYFIDVNKQFYLAICNYHYNFCKSFTPSGVLVKAILLHSGNPMALYENGSGVKLDNPPDFYQGYGRITLKNVLPLLNIYQFNLFVDDLISVSANSKKRYLINVRSADVQLK